jgi:ribosomal protein S18 acetylase RimI-like enzyme
MRKRISVRAAEPRDLDALVPLFEAYRAFYRREPDENAARAFLRDRLRLQDSVVLIAEVESEGVACGFVQLYPVFSSLRMARALILNDLYVAEEYRRVGVARKLMEAAKAFAQISGAVSLSLETAPDNAEARALYESLGYQVEEGFLHYTMALTRSRT